jgi:hypothetical protein
MASRLIAKNFALASLGALCAWVGSPGVAQAECLTPPGDVDGSGLTNVVDVQCALVTSLWYLNNQQGPIPNCVASVGGLVADTNCDTIVNVADVQIVIGYALSIPLSAAIDANGDQCPDACTTSVCGDTACDSGEDCTSCPADCGLCPGSCCTANEAPECTEASCESCVCGLDTFCCDTQWDALCAEAAGSSCLGSCNCPAVGPLSCFGTTDCALNCTGPACVAECLAAADPNATAQLEALVDCAVLAGCTSANLATCVAQFCVAEFSVCEGYTEPVDCCDAAPLLGCDGGECQDCVCSIDEFCCTVGWDGFCAQNAAGNCVAACSCQGGTATCTATTDCIAACTTTGCIQSCIAAGEPGTASQALLLFNCLDTANCFAAADQAAFDACLSANCIPEFSDCAGFVSPFPLTCCDAQPTAGCTDAACEACVCAADPFCCSAQWDSLCVSAAANSCSADCGCAPGLFGCIDAASCALGCSNNLCVEQCFTQAATDSLVATQGLYSCVIDNGCLDLPTTAEFDACLLQFCQTELDVCSDGTCCGFNAGAGCTQSACSTCVCAQDPFCCETSWDAICVQQAATDCGASCGCPEGSLTCIDTVNCAIECGGEGCIEACTFQGQAGTGIEAGALFGCLEASGCIGLADPAAFNTCLATNCNDVFWGCDLAQATGDCCVASLNPGCGDSTCVGCVCDADDFCCTDSWDSLCAEAAAGACAGACGCEPVGGTNCITITNCWLGCPTVPCEQACFAAGSPQGVALSQTLIQCLSTSGCLAATTQAQFNQCLQTNCGAAAAACINQP